MRGLNSSIPAKPLAKAMLKCRGFCLAKRPQLVEGVIF